MPSKQFIDNILQKGRSDDLADTSEATPRNLVIGKDIADDCLDTNIFIDSRGCHLRIVTEFLELLPLLALGEVRLHEPEVATGLALRHGKSHGGALANPVSANFPYMAGDVP